MFNNKLCYTQANSGEKEKRVFFWPVVVIVTVGAAIV